MSMQDKSVILLDLDGTLTDPKQGITKSVQYALAHFGVHVEDLDSLEPFIGPPLSDSFMEFYGFSEEKAAEAIAKYREYFAVDGIFENAPYPGILPLLEDLKAAGKALVLATTKPVVFARRILERFRMAEYFDFVSGSELDGARSDKRELILHGLANCGVSRPDCAVMAGDRSFDILGARAAGVASIGVAWGYGGREELAAAGPDRIAENVEELRRILL